MSNQITIHVLSFGEYFKYILDAVAAFTNPEHKTFAVFMGFLKMTALVGIIMASVGFIKQRDPMIYAKWVMAYVLVFQLLILPKTEVFIYDTSKQGGYEVANVPVVFAVTASLVTSMGAGLAEMFDELFSLPSDLKYTKTGALFGSKLVQAARDFRIIDPDLKQEMDDYFKNCVVGDIRMNDKYSLRELKQSSNIWDLISKQASPLRMTRVNKNIVTCQTAASPKGAFSLKAKLDKEIHNAYDFFGINLFGKTCTQDKASGGCKNHYEKMFETHLNSAFNYYQTMTDSSADIFMQTMMMNAMDDGMKNYQAFTDSTAGIVNNQFSKSQAQHRWGWAIMGEKALWLLPEMHAVLTMLLFGMFPIVLVMSTTPGGERTFKGYLQFFLQLQFWPVLFAMMNYIQTGVGGASTSGHGAISMVNIDKIDELHHDISGIAGYMMCMIPFLAKGMVSSLNEAFSHLSTSMMSHIQGSSMATASEAANASFSLGQTNFHNTSGNNFSANKHDSNWTNMHGMRTEQMPTGVLKTQTASGDTVFDTSPGMTKGPVGVNMSKGLHGSMNQALDDSRQATENESHNYQSSLSNFAHKAMQFSQLDGHDMRLGNGVSETDSGQFNRAISTMSHIASEVAERTGVSKEEAFTRMTSGGVHADLGASSGRGPVGKFLGSVVGVNGGAGLSFKADRSSTSGDRSNDGVDSSTSSREAQDFNDAYSFVKSFTANHHFDDTSTTGASLSNQMGADLRQAETASHNMDASMSRSARISNAASYVENEGANVTENMDQAFPSYVASRVGESQRDELFSHPGDVRSVEKLGSLGQDFIHQKRESLIEEYGNQQGERHVDAVYQQGKEHVASHASGIKDSFDNEHQKLSQYASGLGVNQADANAFQQRAHDEIQGKAVQTQEKGVAMHKAHEVQKHMKAGEILDGKYESTRGVASGHAGADAQEFWKHPIESIKGTKHKETVE
jgi:conjugal transfer mating pair stabilization protein TraG